MNSFKPIGASESDGTFVFLHSSFVKPGGATTNKKTKVAASFMCLAQASSEKNVPASSKASLAEFDTKALFGRTKVLFGHNVGVVQQISCVNVHVHVHVPAARGSAECRSEALLEMARVLAISRMYQVGGVSIRETAGPPFCEPLSKATVVAVCSGESASHGEEWQPPWMS